MMRGEAAKNAPAHVALDVLESLHEGCQVIDYDFRYVLLNTAVVSQARMAKEEMIGRRMVDCYPGIEDTPMFAMLRRCMAEREPATLENEFRYPDGTIGWFELKFVPVPEGVCILSADVTEKKRAQEALTKSEEQLRHAQKMDAIGRLAGGLAHDFNNLLSVIVSYADLTLASLNPGSPIAADVSEIRAAGLRAAELTSQLLTFSRRQVVAPRVLEVNTVLTDMARLLKRVVGEHVDIKLALGTDVGRVKLDPTQLEQIVLNLVINARDAMPEGGRVTIETANADLDATYASTHLGVTPGPHVMVAVSDTGIGMDAATQERIFEPFFTTKAPDKGTGLGLSTVYGIVQQNSGSIWVYSEVGRGSTFKVYFPRTEDASASMSAPPEVRTAQGTETILLVEDEPSVRVLLRKILTQHGYQVLEADGPEEAIRFCDRYSGTIHLLVTDVVMPKMSGRQLAEALAPLRAKLKVLYVSGYTENTVAQQGVLDEGVAFLQKPFTPEALTRKVREVLDASRRAST